MPHYSPNKKWRDTGQPPEPLHIQILSTSPSSKTIDLLTLPPFCLPRRYARLALAFIIALALFHVFGMRMLVYRESPSWDDGRLPHYPLVRDTAPGLNESGLPPLYEEYRKYEDLVSEHNLEERPEDTSRYIFFANHAHGSGWGNVLQEMVFSAMLASEAKLGYVWDDYTWDRTASRYSVFNGKPVPARIPLSTMLSGHILGLGRSTEDNSPSGNLPPSISSRVYQRICPQEDRIIINRTTVQSQLDQGQSGVILSSASGKEILDAWLATLQTPAYQTARCIEVNKNASDPVFDMWLLGSPRMHSLWDTLSRSPALTDWAWSPLIKGSFLKNIHHFAADKDLQESGRIGQFFKQWWWWRSNDQSLPSETASKIVPLPKARADLFNDTRPLPILVLHLRRGDFKAHCNNLAGWSSTYTGFNAFPESRERDAFDVPEVVPLDLKNGLVYPQDDDPREVHSEEEKKRVYAKHCFPEVQQIVKRVKEVVRDYAIFAEDRERKKINLEKLSAREKEGSNLWNGRNSLKDGGRSNFKFDYDEGKEVDKTGCGAGNKHLKKIYIMANGDSEWLEHVKKMLMKSSKLWDGNGGDSGWTWEGIATSLDLDLGWEERPVAHALDMYVAQRAELFIGNGFSNLTSNTVMLRMKARFDSVQTRFW